MSADFKEISDKFNSAGQGHVFKFFENLNEDEKDSFLEQLNNIDLAWVNERYQQYCNEKNKAKQKLELETAPVVELPKVSSDFTKCEEALKAGENALRSGKLAAFLVAGGQGTRLGFDGPKGCYPIGQISGKTLFHIHAEQIRARARKYKTTIPWYIMTSNTNDAETRAFFEKNSYFGFNKKDVMFFRQAMVPAVDFDGKLILEDKTSLAMNPNGHGGSLKALFDSGAIADMKKRGIETISYFQVDNPLVTICDPVFAGYHLLAKAEMSSKILEKTYPEEKVGAICKVDGKITVVEYSDLDETNMYAKDENGRLKFWAGSIAIHMLDVAFVERLAENGLPWHIAIKKIPFLNEKGEHCKPEQTNGVKFETFVFDALPETTSSVTMEVKREDEFAPVKNRTGIDSAESCRVLMNNYAMRILQKCGAEVPVDESGNSRYNLELSYLYALSPDDLAEKIKPGFKVENDMLFE